MCHPRALPVVALAKAGRRGSRHLAWIPSGVCPRLRSGEGITICVKTCEFLQELMHLDKFNAN
ncbi:hypothetical protein COY12_00345 [Candidatus Roizmanbacteria bacterium CG_4_10_14_0_2_um_filter_33_96]|uniref:Uncharacterized protein n=1 Tax=Candidatus Roizmanbacteria bacterium CG_4_10_14_0_2_um_filter_33_96 TaxID=1974821 RepID=A0A2M7UAT0_9BACT|nr:MAG: hypothetical protein COY12_00345 [Candidatus Roizmanbacteria bacterium CG_4_10_14_0_2_um_filter_33_96]